MPSRRNRSWPARRSVSMIQRAAFTLVELLVVVVIAVILLAVTLPTVKYSLEEGKLREGTRQINAFFASARAQAASTGRPVGVWLELTQIGDPSAALGLFQCSQLYMAEVPAAYSGDLLNARAVVRNTQGDNGPLDPTRTDWFLDFADSPGTPPDPRQAPSVASLMANPGGLLPQPQASQPAVPFLIRFDNKGTLFKAERRSNGFLYILNNGVLPPRSNGLSSGASPTNAGYRFEIFRHPQRAGQPLELPQGIVIDMPYSGIGPTGGASLPAQLGQDDLGAAKTAVIIMYSPSGGVASVAYIEQFNNNLVEDVGTSSLYLLVGKTEKMDLPWAPSYLPTLQESNIADGSNLWVTVNRRTGSVATVENTPSFNPQDFNPPQNFPPQNPQEREKFLTRAREFARTGEVKGGQ